MGVNVTVTPGQTEFEGVAAIVTDGTTADVSDKLPKLEPVVLVPAVIPDMPDALAYMWPAAEVVFIA